MSLGVGFATWWTLFGETIYTRFEGGSLEGEKQPVIDLLIWLVSGLSDIEGRALMMCWIH